MEESGFWGNTEVKLEETGSPSGSLRQFSVYQEYPGIDKMSCTPEQWLVWAERGGASWGNNTPQLWPLGLVMRAVKPMCWIKTLHSPIVPGTGLM